MLTSLSCVALKELWGKYCDAQEEARCGGELLGNRIDFFAVELF